MKKYLYLLLLISCTDPHDAEFSEDEDKILVVEGFVTTGLGPHVVEITRTAKYGNIINGGGIKQEKNATVSIRDSKGNLALLSEFSPGVYKTEPSFQGVVGRSYILQIETASGESFASTPELIIEAPEIDSVYVLNKSVPTLTKGLFKKGLEVILEYEDVKDTKNYYLWNTIGTYRIDANPELYLSPETQAPAPKDCCETCWSKEVNKFPQLGDDTNTDGLKTSVPLAFIEDNGIRFSSKYHFRVLQYSITESAYEFYYLLNQQLSIDGDIFDPPPATVRGNIINLTNTNENVIGFFRASDVKEKTFYMYRSQLENPKDPLLIKDDCRLTTNNASIIQPGFWN